MFIDFFLKIFNIGVTSDMEKTFILVQVYPSDIIDSEICCTVDWGNAAFADINKALMPKIANRFKIDVEGYSFVAAVNIERKRVQLLLRKLLNISFDVSVADPVFVKCGKNTLNAFPFFYNKENKDIYETEDYSSTKIVVSILPEWR